MKTLDFNQSIYQATERYPELIQIIAKMGYPQIKNAFLRRTMGKTVTLNQAIRQLNLNKDDVVKQLRALGFDVTG